MGKEFYLLSPSKSISSELRCWFLLLSLYVRNSIPEPSAAALGPEQSWVESLLTGEKAAVAQSQSDVGLILDSNSLAMGPWASYLITWVLNFLFCKVKKTILRWLCQLNEIKAQNKYSINGNYCCHYSCYPWCLLCVGARAVTASWVCAIQAPGMRPRGSLFPHLCDREPLLISAIAS